MDSSHDVPMHRADHRPQAQMKIFHFTEEFSCPFLYGALAVGDLLTYGSTITKYKVLTDGNKARNTL